MFVTRKNGFVKIFARFSVVLIFYLLFEVELKIIPPMAVEWH